MAVAKKVLKKALPIALSFVAAKAVANKLAANATVGAQLSKLGQHQGPVVAAALAVVGHVATKKVRMLAKHREGVMVGLGLNVLHQAFKVYALPHLPASVQGALSEYVQMGEYVQMNEYVQMQGVGGYEQDLGEFYGETGAFYGEMGDDAGMYPSQLGPVGTRSGLYQAPSVPALVPAEEFGESDLNAGIFAGAMFS